MAESGANAQDGTNLVDSQASTAAAYNKSQLDQHERIMKMLKFVRKCDHVDESVVFATENNLATPPTVNGGELLMEDVLDIIYSLIPVESLLQPDFSTIRFYHSGPYNVLWLWTW